MVSSQRWQSVVDTDSLESECYYKRAHIRRAQYNRGRTGGFHIVEFASITRQEVGIDAPVQNSTVCAATICDSQVVGAVEIGQHA